MSVYFSLTDRAFPAALSPQTARDSAPSGPLSRQQEKGKLLRQGSGTLCGPKTSQERISPPSKWGAESGVEAAPRTGEHLRLMSDGSPFGGEQNSSYLTWEAR